MEQYRRTHAGPDLMTTPAPATEEEDGEERETKAPRQERRKEVEKSNEIHISAGGKIRFYVGRCMDALSVPAAEVPVLHK
jgi:hypothetical protein